MRSVVTVEIDRPKDELTDLLADMSTSVKWMDDLQSFEHLAGAPGAPGSTSRLVFNGNGKPTVFIATQLESTSPDEVCSLLDSSMVSIEATGRLIAITDSKTKYVSEQTFNFKGFFNKLAGFLARPVIKKQQHKHAVGFKQFAEAGARLTNR